MDEINFNIKNFSKADKKQGKRRVVK